MTRIDTYRSIIPHPVKPDENGVGCMSACLVSVRRGGLFMVVVDFLAGELVPGYDFCHDSCVSK